MTKNKNQLGVGLIEVLVALLILAVGVMGFIALQYRAIEATAESGSRVQAINLARDLAERMRVNRGAEEVYAFQLNTSNTQRIFPTDCFESNCSSTDLADFDVAQIATKARISGMTVNYLPCQGNTDNRRCIYVAWGDTAATDGEENGNCTAGASYEQNSTCLIMEVY